MLLLGDKEGRIQEIDNEQDVLLIFSARQHNEIFATSSHVTLHWSHTCSLSDCAVSTAPL